MQIRDILWLDIKWLQDGINLGGPRNMHGRPLLQQSDDYRSISLVDVPQP